MIKVNVAINNKSWHKKIKYTKKYFNQKLKKISNIIKFFRDKNITFTILLTNSLNVKKLNKKFRKRNKSTDVLSFPSFSPKRLQLMKEKKIYIGDLAASYEAIYSRSKKKNFLKEFHKVWLIAAKLPKHEIFKRKNYNDSYHGSYIISVMKTILGEEEIEE